MNSHPHFSVIIPTYQRNDLLAKCLDCLAPGVQTLSSEQYEVIVTDDGSEITAEAMIQEKYPWAKWVPGPRRGPAANRNNGASYAQGEWLAFTDDDCLPSSNWLAAFASAITPDIQVYEGKTTCEAGLRSPLEHAPINLIGGCLWSCNLTIKKSIFQTLKGFDENFPYPHMEDVDLRERILNAGYVFSFIKDAVIDHPPKKQVGGKHLGVLHESEYYWYCKKGIKFSVIDFLRLVSVARLRNILKYPISLDSIKALISLSSELHYTYSNFKSWQERY